MTKRKEYRPMTVGECSDYGRNSFPMLRIKGMWLKQLVHRSIINWTF